MDRKRLESMTDDELMVAELMRIVRAERAKGHCGDEEAVQDCFDQISEITGIPRDEVEETIEAKVKEEQGQRKRRRLSRIIAGFAAAVVMITGITACSVNPVFMNWLKDIVRMPVGTSVEADGVTYTYLGNSIEYDSIEDIIKKEELGVFFPVTDDYIRVRAVKRMIIDSYDSIVVAFDDTEMSYTIYMDCDEKPEVLGYESEFYVNDMVLYISSYYVGDNKYYVANGNDGNNYYVLRTSSNEALINLINSIEKGK